MQSSVCCDRLLERDGKFPLFFITRVTKKAVKLF